MPEVLLSKTNLGEIFFLLFGTIVQEYTKKAILNFKSKIYVSGAENLAKVENIFSSKSQKPNIYHIAQKAEILDRY